LGLSTFHKGVNACRTKGKPGATRGGKPWTGGKRGNQAAYTKSESREGNKKKGDEKKNTRPEGLVCGMGEGPMKVKHGSALPPFKPGEKRVGVGRSKAREKHAQRGEERTKRCGAFFFGKMEGTKAFKT